MTTERPDNSRWTEPFASVHYRADGSLVENPELTEQESLRLERISDAWQVYNLTGDRSELVKLGILPENPDEGT